MSEKINKDILANEIAEQYGLSKSKSRKIVDGIFDRISDVVLNNGKASIYGFGMFETKERPERNGFNPATKEPMLVKASVVPIFKPAKPLKDAFSKKTQ